MNYLPLQTWNSLPIPAGDFRPRFFVECFRERLSMHTPHFYQSRLMTVFSSCAEALIYVDEQRSGLNAAVYLKLAIDELEDCWKRDSIAKELFAYTDDIRTSVIAAIKKDDISELVLTKLSLFCNALVSRADEYHELLLKKLKLSLTEVANLTKKGRITKQIHTLTGLYVSHLLYEGYSPTYLFNRMSYFERASHYGPRNFEAQFTAVTNRLQNSKRNFDVFFWIHTNKPQQLLEITDDSDFSFLDQIDPRIQGVALKKFTQGERVVIAKTCINSTDYVSAAWRAKEKLNKLLDAVTALELNPRVSAATTCATVSEFFNQPGGQSVTNVETINVDLLVGFLVSELGTSFTTTSSSIRSNSVTLNEKGKERLGRSFRYLRLARESISLEQKVLNLWISLESIFSDGGTGIIGVISKHIPQIYALTGIHRRVSYLKSLLVRNTIATTPLYQSQIDGALSFTNQTTDENIFKLLRNENATKELVSSLGGDKEHLVYRIISTFEELEDNQKVVTRVDMSSTDVARQLRRIYFLRNKITHSGHYESIRPQLISHLIDYIAVCYHAISDTINKSKCQDIHTIDDILLSYQLAVEFVIKNCKEKILISDLKTLTPLPVI